MYNFFVFIRFSLDDKSWEVVQPAQDREVRLNRSEQWGMSVYRACSCLRTLFDWRSNHNGRSEKVKYPKIILVSKRIEKLLPRELKNVEARLFITTKSFINIHVGFVQVNASDKTYKHFVVPSWCCFFSRANVYRKGSLSKIIPSRD